MSWNQPPPGQPSFGPPRVQYYPPPQGQHPQGAYGPPPGPPPPGSAYGAPPAGYALQAHPGASTAPYGATPSGYYQGHPQGHIPYAAPPSGYQLPQFGGYGAPPPGGYATPPPGSYGAPPGGYASPASPYQYVSPSQGYYPPPQPQGYPGGPPVGYLQPGYYSPPTGYPVQQYYPPPTFYLGTPIPPHQLSHVAPPPPQGYHDEVEKMRKATKGLGTDDSAVIDLLSRFNAVQIDEFARAYAASKGTNLLDLLKKETSGHFEEALVGVIEGPLRWDVTLLDRACAGTGTNETLLTELLMDRTNAEIHALRAAYSIYGAKKDKHTLDALVAGELSGRTQSMFTIALAANRNESDVPNPYAPAPLQPPSSVEVERDVHTITSYRNGHDQTPLCSIILNSSKTHLNAIAHYIKEKKILPQHQTLRDFINNNFSGHMKDALIYVVEGCLITRDPSGQQFAGVERDAEKLALAMKGSGTKDRELTYRLIRAHWNKPRFEAIKAVYPRTDDKHQTLLARVKSETSGSYGSLLCAIVGV